jgi:glycine betaine/proline transport system substrate-binding protein
MRILNSTLLALLLTCILATGVVAEDLPGKGKTIRPARATWNTGYFHAALYERALADLGYEIADTKELSNPIFYTAVSQGDIDYWPNSWLPNHEGQMPAGFYDNAELVGYVVKAGGMQGYLASKDLVEKYDIKTVDDFKRAEVKEAFDRNGDGKADMVACPPGWGCEKVITHHMDVYDLEDHINPIKAAYEASMADALAAYNAGEPVFFYTWAPNWTIFKLKPGEDVMWIGVPEILPLESQEAGRDRMTQTGIEGAVSDPIELGWVVSDIRVAANSDFLAENPAVRRFFEVASVPLEDINAQNTKMNEGEDSPKDIERHVIMWIADNKETYDGWLAEARKAAK